MQLRKIIQRRIRHEREGVSVVGDVNAVISANLNEGASRTGTTPEPKRGGADGEEQEGPPGR